jgi:hypothetical protein
MITPVGFQFIPMTGRQLTAVSDAVARLVAQQTAEYAILGMTAGVLLTLAIGWGTRAATWYLRRRHDAKAGS